MPYTKPWLSSFPRRMQPSKLMQISEAFTPFLSVEHTSKKLEEFLHAVHVTPMD